MDLESRVLLVITKNKVLCKTWVCWRSCLFSIIVLAGALESFGSVFTSD